MEKEQPAGHWLKMSTALLPTSPPVQRISTHPQRLKARLPPPNTRPPASHITHNLPISTTQYKKHKPMPPPANMANPCSGSEVAASALLATLSAAVVQRPLVASKMSTTLLRPPPAQQIGAHLQRLRARIPRLHPTHAPPPPTSLTISQYQQLNTKNTYAPF